MNSKTTTLADRGFDRLERDIISGVYKKGEILTELRLVEELGVSRTPIREALRRLGQERLIREGVPGMVTQMAYQPYRRVPDIPLPTNILVMVAERGPWSIPYPSHVKREYDEIKAWAKKLGHRVAIWTYPCKYGQRNVPNIPSGSPWM